MSIDRGIRVVEAAPFVGEIVEPFSCLHDVRSFMAKQAMSEIGESFQAITGTVLDYVTSLNVGPKVDDNHRVDPMVLHCHNYGVLLYSCTQREGDTLVFPNSAETRPYYRGDLTFEHIREIQEKSLEEYPAFRRDWKVASRDSWGRVETPFLFLKPLAVHLRAVESRDQFRRKSELSTWRLEGNGQWW